MPSKGMVVAAADRPKPPPRTRKIGRKTLTAIVAAIAGLVLLVSGWVGYAIRGDKNAGTQVTVRSTFTGTVSIVNQANSAGCVQPDNGGQKVCSNFAVLYGGIVHQGDSVHAAHEIVSTGGGNGYDLLLIYPQDAP